MCVDVFGRLEGQRRGWLPVTAAGWGQVMQVCLRAAAGLPEHLHLARAHLRPTTLAPCFAEGHTPLTVEDVRDPRNLAALLPTVGDFWGDYFFVPGSRPAVGLHIQTFDITSIFYFLYNFGVLRQDRCGAGFAPWGVSRMLYNPRTGWLVLLFIPRAPPAGSSPAGLRLPNLALVQSP